MRILTTCMNCYTMEYIDTTEMVIKVDESNLRYRYVSILEADCEYCGGKITVAQFEEYDLRAVEMLLKG